MKNLLVFFIAFVFSGLNAQVTNREAKKWKKDLLEMKSQLAERHVNLYHTITEEVFDSAVANLNEDIPFLNTNQILVRFAQLVAMIGDGHTSFYPGDQKRYRFSYFPVRFWKFSDGIYVIAATGEYKHLLGKKLKQVENSLIEEVFKKISTTVGADNPMEYTYSVPFELRRPELLQALGFTKFPEQAEFVFEDGTHEVLIGQEIKVVEYKDWYSANNLYENKKVQSKSLNYLFATRLTLEMIKQHRNYWFTYMEDEQALHFQYNSCWDQKGQPTFEETTRELFAYLDSHPVERLIIDLRQNSGGEPLTAKPLIDELKKRKEFCKEGRLFVLVGRRTFSAALSNAATLRSVCGARTVGEAPRGKPNNPSEGRDIRLKRTKTKLTVSTQFVARDSTLGNSKYLPIEIPVQVEFSSFHSAKDKVLSEALKARILFK